MNRALALGIDSLMHDTRRLGKSRSLSDLTTSYLIGIACIKPSDLSQRSKMWTNRSLTEYIRENALEEYDLV
ncbi:MAG: hypothetical protein AMDU1_APLC00096G0003 [Thermoplasmatales archaeon A-plasma]|jgi:hypothetical protein|nr:MAG: hypothetical protein AMDU1_APLC00096G0003 [Thermoplasmatales archaeon A-plasma]WMT44182.1 MAG: hypothetical protein RE469_08235 [Cuniculiplasma divulgatum]